jgi:hypothetical protein
MATFKQEFVFFNDNVGHTLGGAKLFFYAAGTTNPKDTYTTSALTDKNEWPVIADAAGRFPIMWLETGAYDVVLKNSDGVQIDTREGINASEATILLTSDFYFSNLVDLKQGISISGESLNLTIGQIARTVDNSTPDDKGGAEWEVVAADTGVADDDLFSNLDNGLQVKRKFNQLYTNRNLGEIADAGAIAQQAARDNLGGILKVITGDIASAGSYTNTATYNTNQTVSVSKAATGYYTVTANAGSVLYISANFQSGATDAVNNIIRSSVSAGVGEIRTLTSVGGASIDKATSFFAVVIE